jgi:hypothetical protein
VVARARPDRAVSSARLALLDAARKFGRDCGGAAVQLDVYRARTAELVAAARLFVAAEERRDLEAG